MANLETLEEQKRRDLERWIGAWNTRVNAAGETVPAPIGQTRRLLDEYKKSYTEISSNLNSVYATQLSGISPDDAGYYNAMLKYNRLKNLQKQTMQSYTSAARAAAKIQFDMGETGMANTYYYNMYAANWFADTGYFTLLDRKAVEVSVYGTPEIWAGINQKNIEKYSPYLPKYGTLAERLNANATKDLDRIQSAITQGLRQGKAYTTVARDLRGIFETTANNALRIARTEGNRNLNAGAYAQSIAASEAGINIMRQYVATLDTRTREQSGAMDGQRRKPDKPFTYGGYSWFIPGNSGNPAYDVNDRCTVIDIVDGKGPEIRRGRNPVTNRTEVADYGSFDDWMEKHNLTRNNSGRIIRR